ARPADSGVPGAGRAGAAPAPASVGRASIGAGMRCGALEQAASKPRIAAGRKVLRRPGAFTMWLILLEAFGALAVLLLIVWWTMFVGRRRGERK
ncbi:MAG TPA: hypothetical protein VF308_04570, partial [Caldimonas sp.]